jgi:hypothetical protein
MIVDSGLRLLGEQRPVLGAGLELICHRDQLLEAFARTHELPLETIAVACHIRCYIVHENAMFLASDRVDDHWDHAAVTVQQLELYLGHRALHAQQWCPVRLMEDPAADGEQFLEACPLDQLRRVAADPSAEGPVGA